MADHHHRTGKFQQRVFESAQGFHVQVIRGLIEHQHVAARDQRFGQMQASALAAGQGADALLLVAAVEVEAPAISAARHLELADVQNVQPAGDIFPDGFFVRQVVAVLIDKSHFDGRALDDFAAVGLLFTGNQLEQRRFTRAVGADDADDSARRNRETQVVDQHTVAKGLGDVVELDDLMAQTLGHGNENFVGFDALLVFKVGQFLETGQARFALGLARFRVLARPFEFLFQGFGTGFFALLLQR